MHAVKCRCHKCQIERESIFEIQPFSLEAGESFETLDSLESGFEGQFSQSGEAEFSTSRPVKVGKAGASGRWRRQGGVIVVLGL